MLRLIGFGGILEASMNSRDFGVVEDAFEAAKADVAPVLHMSPAERYARFLDVVSFFEGVWKSLDPALRARSARASAAADDPGRWWERIPRP